MTPQFLKIYLETIWACSRAGTVVDEGMKRFGDLQAVLDLQQNRPDLQPTDLVVERLRKSLEEAGRPEEDLQKLTALLVRGKDAADPNDVDFGQLSELLDSMNAAPGIGFDDFNSIQDAKNFFLGLNPALYRLYQGISERLLDAFFVQSRLPHAYSMVASMSTTRNMPAEYYKKVFDNIMLLQDRQLISLQHLFIDQALPADLIEWMTAELKSRAPSVLEDHYFISTICGLIRLRPETGPIFKRLLPLRRLGEAFDVLDLTPDEFKTMFSELRGDRLAPERLLAARTPDKFKASLESSYTAKLDTIALLKNPGCPDEVLEQGILSMKHSPEILIQLLQCRKKPFTEKQLETFMQANSYRVDEELALRRDLPAGVTWKLQERYSDFSDEKTIHIRHALKHGRYYKGRPMR